MSEPKVLTEGDLRGLIRKMVREYVANDTPYNANKHMHPDPSAAEWDKGMDEDNAAPLVDMDESEEDHTDDHGGEKRSDPRWDTHADPTAKAWDTGLDDS